jgi:hypothetical protein
MAQAIDVGRRVRCRQSRRRHPRAGCSEKEADSGRSRLIGPTHLAGCVDAPGRPPRSVRSPCKSRAAGRSGAAGGGAARSRRGIFSLEQVFIRRPFRRRAGRLKRPVPRLGINSVSLVRIPPLVPVRIPPLWRPIPRYGFHHYCPGTDSTTTSIFRSEGGNAFPRILGVRDDVLSPLGGTGRHGSAAPHVAFIGHGVLSSCVDHSPLAWAVSAVLRSWHCGKSGRAIRPRLSLECGAIRVWGRACSCNSRR